MNYRLITVCATCTVICFAGLVSCRDSQTAASGVESVNFDGDWDGKYTPSRGEPGEGKYKFATEKAGQWHITVSWVEGKETKSMNVKGERLGPDALRLQGKYGDTKYWYIGRMEGTTLTFRYLSVNE